MRRAMESEAKLEKNQKLLRPSLDFVFKRIFGSREQKKILVCLLNSILNDNPRIESIELDNPEIPRETIDSREVRLDILARTPQGTLVTVEIQCANAGNVIHRSIFYQARLMSLQLESGDSYDRIPDIISIWIANYPATGRNHHTNEIVNMYRSNEIDPIEIATSKFRTFIIELPKIDLENIPQRRRDIFTSWMTFLKQPELVTEDIINNIPEIGEAMKVLKYVSADGEFREVCEARFRAQNDEYSRITVARDEGKLEGKLEGKQEIALAMLENGVAMDIIVKCTGLSEREIIGLENNR
ncbi:MAG: Rpn family recombination-promoting nuclease/putative transposase [Rickettsiales bacterium]|jgi:predicted transposase/invertase (TIGR01784 family)|nr:Rpn family recombination-promoting nuclease/putative transposase [Rickettsiales bacterium]